MVFKDAFGNGKTSAYSLFYIDCEMKQNYYLDFEIQGNIKGGFQKNSYYHLVDETNRQEVAKENKFL